jgi:hypothetical protein
MNFEEVIDGIIMKVKDSIGGGFLLGRDKD